MKDMEDSVGDGSNRGLIVCTSQDNIFKKVSLLIAKRRGLKKQEDESMV